jgi:hypothetical protein
VGATPATPPGSEAAETEGAPGPQPPARRLDHRDLGARRACGRTDLTSGFRRSRASEPARGVAQGAAAEPGPAPPAPSRRIPSPRGGAGEAPRERRRAEGGARDRPGLIQRVAVKPDEGGGLDRDRRRAREHGGGRARPETRGRKRKNGAPGCGAPFGKGGCGDRATCSAEGLRGLTRRVKGCARSNADRRRGQSRPRAKSQALTPVATGRRIPVNTGQP